jgi:hypothetical protein
MGRPVPNPPRPNRTKALTRTFAELPSPFVRLCLSFCHSLRKSASSFAVAFAFLSVIPSGNLLLPLPLPLSFFLSFPPGICFFLCPRLSFCHSLRESASSFAVAFLSVIPSGNLLLPLPLPFSLSFPPGICFFLCPRLSFCHSLWESAFVPAVDRHPLNRNATSRSPQHPSLSPHEQGQRPAT